MPFELVWATRIAKNPFSRETITGKLPKLPASVSVPRETDFNVKA
jgi:hypothetical protein